MSKDESNDFMKGLSIGILLMAIAFAIGWFSYCVGRLDGRIDAKAEQNRVPVKEVGRE